MPPVLHALIGFRLADARAAQAQLSTVGVTSQASESSLVVAQSHAFSGPSTNRGHSLVVAQSHAAIGWSNAPVGDSPPIVDEPPIIVGDSTSTVRGRAPVQER
jgi:hypothetical protein